MSGNYWFELVLAILATYRVAQFIAVDEGPYRVFAEWRAFLGRRSSQNATWKTLAELFWCPYCIGVWVAGMLALTIQPQMPVLWWLAVAGGQAVLEELRNAE